MYFLFYLYVRYVCVKGGKLMNFEEKKTLNVLLVVKICC